MPAVVVVGDGLDDAVGGSRQTGGGSLSSCGGSSCWIDRGGVVDVAVAAAVVVDVGLLDRVAAGVGPGLADVRAA